MYLLDDILINSYFLSGFNAYVGYLLLEHTHANPVLVTFCQLLIKTMIDRQAPEQGKCFGGTNHVVAECSSKLQYCASNRWHLNKGFD